MRKPFATCALALAVVLCLAGSAWAAAPDSAPGHAPAVAGAQAAPNTVKPLPLPAFLNQLAPAAPPKDGARIGTPEPIYKTCPQPVPGNYACQKMCTGENPACTGFYQCFANGTWSCTCLGPLGGVCDPPA